MVIDSHCHLAHELPVDRLLATMDAGGIDRAVLIAAAERPVGRVGSAGPAFFRGCMAVPALRMPMYRVARRVGGLVPLPAPNNEPVYAAAAAHPDRFLPFAFLNPTLADANNVLDRALETGARGAKMHAWFHGFRLPDAVPLLRRCAQHRLPVLVHLGFGPAEDVGITLERVPGLKLILAHAGLPHFERVWTEPVWFDVAAPQLVSRRVIERLVARAGADRVLFGSDAPIGIRSDESHRYVLRDLPDRAMGANLESLLA